MKVTWRFEGGKELAAALQSLPDRVSRKIQREVLKDIAEPMRARAAQMAPRGDPKAPNLADEMNIGNARSDDGSVAVSVGPAPTAYYGRFVEFGTINMSARPFLRPAFDSTAPQALVELGKRLWVELAGRGVSRVGSASGPIMGGPGGDTL